MDNYFEREWGGMNIMNGWDNAMDDFEEEYGYVEDEQEEYQYVGPARVYRERVCPFETLTELEFKRHFRFSKDNVIRLTEFMEIPRPRNNRGLPISAEMSMCLFLSHVGGAHFNRVTGLCGDVSKKAAWCAIERVRRCIMAKKDAIIQLPTEREMAATAKEMKRRFGLPGKMYLEVIPYRYQTIN